MRYTKFRIENYRAIQDSIEIDLEKGSLIPIIGVNESGKTTILHAIFAFDPYNDTLNHGEHLKDVRNLHQTKEQTALVTAEIALTPDEFMIAVDRVLSEERSDTELIEALNAAASGYRETYRSMPETLMVTRNLSTKRFSFPSSDLFGDSQLNDLIARNLILYLHYILFFDDFRDSVPDAIEIKKDEQGRLSDWLATIAELFKQADEDYSVFDIPDSDSRIRDTALSRVSRYLNETLSKEWQNYRLDDTAALNIDIAYEKEVVDDDVRHLLKFRVSEEDASGYLHYFHIRNRSKGFFWFFNFVMKLEFNPKMGYIGEAATICLLDEPGSYLHGSAQSKLCKKLRSISEASTVIYCTHSHHLLDPELIPLSSIKVADKDGLGNIDLVPIHQYRGKAKGRRLAFQPVIDALQIRPFLLDMSIKRVVITEGIVDFYAFEMFKPSSKIGVLPSTNADSIKYYISFMIAWGVEYRALWDNDLEGQRHHARATEAFGEAVAQDHFFLLPPKPPGSKKRILQNLFDGQDLKLIRSELGWTRNPGFDQTIEALFYSPDRAGILKKISARTKQNFNEVFSMMGLR